METQSVLLTWEGYRKLEQELNYLSTVRRGQVAERLRQVFPDGDVLENAGLEDARNEQSFLEGRIQTLKSILGHAIIIEDTSSCDVVGLGSYVTVTDLTEDSALETYRIVGSTEADPIQGSISNESPLGQKLLGRKVGEQVMVDAPDGQLVFKLVSIHQGNLGAARA
jgi:transcription elongation factor GreA